MNLVNQTISHYRIVSQLGAGGMGEVYLAEDTQLGRRVAIKFLSPELVADERANKRLVREARAAATLDHPNICSIYEVGEADGRSFIAMQYIEGETLDVRIKRKPLELKESLTIAAQIADALAEAHSHSIIHRDIKPSNIMITSRGQAKVMDFGLAKVAQTELSTDSEVATQSLLTEPGTIMGTVQYMSPEQVRGEVLDGRSDVFSFGVVLYEMLTGRKPFECASAAETIAEIQTREPLPIARFAIGSPAELQRIMTKTLAKDRDLRYQTMRDLAIDLHNVRRELEFEGAVKSRGDQTLSAPEDLATGTVAKPSRPFVLGTVVAATLVVAIAALIGYSILSRRVSGPSSPQIRSLAVLPLRSLSREPNDEYLGLGIADTIITRASQVGELEVRPMSAVTRFNSQQVDAAEIARQLEVDSVLEGTVQRSGDLVRVSVSLLRAADAKQLWTDNFTRQMNELFALQDDVSLSLVRALKLHLTATEEQSIRTHTTSNAEAYDSYLRGEFYLSRPAVRANLTKALEMFERATALDPSFALAHIGIANTCVGIIFSFEPNNKQLEERAYVAIEKALALDPNLAEAYRARGSLLWTRANGFPHERAAIEYKHALAINPNLADAHGELGSLYFHIGLLDKALVELETTRKLDPAGTFAPLRIARIHWYEQKYEEAESEFQSIQNFDDEKALTLWHLGRKDEARTLLEDSLKNPQRVVARGSDMAAAYAVMLADAGENVKAEKQIRVAIRDGHEASHFHHAQFSIACAYALMGKNDLAVEWLKNCAENGMPCYTLFESEPALKSLHADAKYLALMASLKKQWEGYKTTL